MANIQNTSSGRTSQARSPQTRARISEQSSKQSAPSKKSEIDIPRYDKWPNAGLVMADNFSVAWRVFDAQYWGSSPEKKNASTLSQILMDCEPERYYLSQKACLGILSRASKRGKELPEVLKAALERQAQSA